VGERNFVTRYCRRLGIPLYLYTVEWLRRDSVDRAFYEEMTRELRFSVYRALERPVFLGHIQEDVVENIWTNFARGTHLDDLAKFHPTVMENGVQICRPWLQIRKADIYVVAAELAIPHLKNTTPTWSNRGKFREHFYAATHAQFERSVDDKVLEVADRLTKQSALLDKLLYTPIRESWDGESIDITLAIQHDVDAEGWQRILTDLAHSRLGIGKPSIASCANFRNRVQRETYNGQRMTLRKDFVVCIRKTGGQIRLCTLLQP
jgi:tRNA(Ile)-lysidine synthase TilS/MesJ